MQLRARAEARALIQAKNVFSLLLNEKAPRKNRKQRIFLPRDNNICEDLTEKNCILISALVITALGFLVQLYSIPEIKVYFIQFDCGLRVSSELSYSCKRSGAPTWFPGEYY